MKRQSYMVKVLRVGECARSMVINAPELACRYWKKVIEKQSWFDPGKETLIVLLLSAKYYVEGFSLVSIGSLTESIAHPREIFRAAIVGGCYGIVLMHNHPSGFASPSVSDHGLTRRLSEAAELLEIRLLDHVIVGKPGVAAPIHKSRGRRFRRLEKLDRLISRQGYYSFKEAGVL